MPQILVDQVEQSVENACQCWGDLLDLLDQRGVQAGQVLTAVRFDGVDQPSFRDSWLVTRPLASLAVVEVESARPRDLLESSIDDAVTAAETLAGAADRVGGAFRGFDVANASQDLSELAQGLGTLMAIGQALGQATGTSIEKMTCQHGTGSQMIQALTAHTEALIDSQQSGDWITVADVVEYDIAPALRQWPSLFEALRASVPDDPRQAA